MPEAESNLLPPPRLMPEAEFPPIIEPPLRELGQFPGVYPLEDWEPVASEPLDEERRAELSRQAMRAAPWYCAHLFHDASEPSSDWHGAGPNLIPFGSW